MTVSVTGHSPAPRRPMPLFAPPKISASPELVWTLLRAYARLGCDVPPGDPAARSAVARSLQLATRITARQSPETLDAELGKELGDSCRASLQRQVFNGLAVVRMIQECADAAKSTGVDVVLLKFAALHERGMVHVSSRPAADLDILVAPDDIERLSDALSEGGATRLEKWVPSHHPAVFLSRFGKNIEIHTRLPQVRLKRDAGYATLSELRDIGLLEPSRGDGAHFYLPRVDLVLGHLIAHALVAHAYAPAAYPVLRVLSDSVDVRLGDDESLATDAAQWIARDVPRDEVVTLRELTQHCTNGRVAELLESESRAALLLRHLLASAIDEKYRRKLRIRRVLQVFDEVGLGETLLHAGRRIRRDLDAWRAKR